MENFINTIKNTIPLNVLLILIAVLIIAIILIFVLLGLRKKRVKKQLEDYENLYNEIKNIPLAFKLNNAVALSRVNEKMAESVDACRGDYDQIQESLKTCSCELAEIDDLVYGHKVKNALKRMEELDEHMTVLKTLADKVNAILDSILEKENEQRVAINKLKTAFHTAKKQIMDHRVSYAHSFEHLETLIAEIEKQFSVYEEWMFAFEFNKASETHKVTAEKIDELQLLADELPGLYERAKGILPHAIDEVGFSYAQVKNKGVYLDHLEVHKNLDFVSDMLKECLAHLRNGEIEGISGDLDDCEKRISQLQEQIEKEDKAFIEIKDNLMILFDSVKAINKDVEDINALYNRVCARFGFENWTDKLKEVDEKLAALNDMKRSLEYTLKEQKQPFTTVLIAYKELEQSVSLFNAEVLEMKQKLETACSDEERAKKQLVRLQLILNEIRVNMRKHRLPSVSDKFEDDLHRGELLIKDIRVVLDNSPLDVKRLNADLRNAIDYVYTLYNNVNNLVGMAVMVENAVVFANRYRSTYPDVDSELTRAELCFRNGQYTKALKISLQCIEKLHPGAYEKIISKKESSLLKGEL